MEISGGTRSAALSLRRSLREYPYKVQARSLHSRTLPSSDSNNTASVEAANKASSLCSHTARASRRAAFSSSSLPLFSFRSCGRVFDADTSPIAPSQGTLQQVMLSILGDRSRRGKSRRNQVYQQPGDRARCRTSRNVRGGCSFLGSCSAGIGVRRTRKSRGSNERWQGEAP